MNNDLSLDSHISRRFNEELEEVRHKVLVMGGLVEKQVADGLTALLNSDSSLGEVVAGADFEINAMESD